MERAPRPTRIAAFVGVSIVGAVAYAAAVAVPTAVIHTPFFTRMTPATTWSYVFLVVPALLAGPLLASYVVPLRPAACSPRRRTLAGGVLSYLAVGCPICNKLIVAILGVSGALTYFQPLQPVLGGAAVLLLAYSLWLRLRRPPPRPFSAASPAPL